MPEKKDNPQRIAQQERLIRALEKLHIQLIKSLYAQSKPPVMRKAESTFLYSPGS